jgi:hypothetical protein
MNINPFAIKSKITTIFAQTILLSEWIFAQNDIADG